jgi:hypothetical protein
VKWPAEAVVAIVAAATTVLVAVVVVASVAAAAGALSVAPMFLAPALAAMPSF